MIKKIIETFNICESCQGHPLTLIFENKIKVIKCPMCKGTGLRIKKRIFHYHD